MEAAAVNHYIKTGKNRSHTIRVLGYPCRPTLRKWILELAPGEKKACKLGQTQVRYTYDEKIEAVARLQTREIAAEEVAEELSVSRSSLYRWERELTNNRSRFNMMKSRNENGGNSRKCRETYS